MQVKDMFIEGNEDLVLKKNKNNNTTKSTHKNLKQNKYPDMAFQNLTPSQKSLFKQKSLPLVSCNLLFTHRLSLISRSDIYILLIIFHDRY